MQAKPHDNKSLNHLMKELQAVKAERDALREQLDRQQTVLDRLPMTADGVYLLPGDKAWAKTADGTARYVNVEGRIQNKVPFAVYVNDMWNDMTVADCFSTREAAEAAGG